MLKLINDDLKDGLVIDLLQRHYQEMLLHSPIESVHALDTAALFSKDLSFWSLRKDKQLAGCGALKHLNSAEGEIKSMRTEQAFIRQGVAAHILDHIINEARTRGYEKLYLETGSMAFFEPARRLYKKYGFVECPPFADYFEDTNSVCMVKSINK